MLSVLKQLPLLFIECDCLLDNIDIDISAELEKELVSHTEIDMAVLYKSLYKKLSHFTSVAENENIPFIRLLYKNFNFEIKTYGKMGYLFRTILQYLIRFRFGKYDVYVLWHNYGDKDPLKKISVEGVDYARKLVKKFQGKTMRIYSGTEMVNIDIFNQNILTVRRNQGIGRPHSIRSRVAIAGSWPHVLTCRMVGNFQTLNFDVAASGKI